MGHGTFHWRLETIIKSACNRAGSSRAKAAPTTAPARPSELVLDARWNSKCSVAILKLNKHIAILDLLSSFVICMIIKRLRCRHRPSPSSYTIENVRARADGPGLAIAALMNSKSRICNN